MSRPSPASKGLGQANLPLVLWLCLVMLLNAAAPAALAASQGAGPQRFLICTSDGFKWVNVEQASDEPPATQATRCIYCLNLDHDIIEQNHSLDKNGKPAVIFTNNNYTSTTTRSIFRASSPRAPPPYL